MAARACARAQRGKINTATTKVSVPSAAGGGGKGRQERCGRSREQPGAVFCFVFFFLKLEDSNARYLPSPLFPGNVLCLPVLPRYIFLLLWTTLKV